MSKPPKPDQDRSPGVEEAPAEYHDREHAETCAALEEYRRTGISYDAEDVLREFMENVRKRSARKR
jgi:hypothetical protein